MFHPRLGASNASNAHQVLSSFIVFLHSASSRWLVRRLGGRQKGRLLHASIHLDTGVPAGPGGRAGAPGLMTDGTVAASHGRAFVAVFCRHLHHGHLAAICGQVTDAAYRAVLQPEELRSN